MKRMRMTLAPSRHHGPCSPILCFSYVLIPYFMFCSWFCLVIFACSFVATVGIYMSFMDLCFHVSSIIFSSLLGYANINLRLSKTIVWTVSVYHGMQRDLIWLLRAWWRTAEAEICATLTSGARKGARRGAGCPRESDVDSHREKHMQRI